MSDPLDEGSNFFGTASGGIDYGLIGAEAVWYVQVAALVVGHVIALAIGHDKALAEYRTVGRATQSQYWMLALMVSFTVLGLMLLSSANRLIRARIRRQAHPQTRVATMSSGALSRTPGTGPSTPSTPSRWWSCSARSPSQPCASGGSA